MTGYNRNSLFKGTVYDSFYGATFAADPTLNIVNTAADGTYKGSPVPRTLGYAFIATGAFLTDNIPRYDFSYDELLLNDDSQPCPINHPGNLK